MKRITGTHAYTYARCPHAVALDLHEDHARRRAPTEVEAFVLQRGRALEERLTAELGYARPGYPERDFEAGAEATQVLLHHGVAGVLQGVLLGDGRLGVPDLLRREPGASALGDHHYVVGDVKSSGTGRGDQILQIMFYARLLARVQQRAPAYCYLLLRDGHEEQFATADYDAVIAEVEEALDALRERRAATRPFLSSSCGSCHWSDLCLPELEAGDDLSLLQGMTRGLRSMLEAAGPTTCAAVQHLAVEPTARRIHVESALLRRLKKAAQARALRRPIRESVAAALPAEIALVHLLQDQFAERVLWFGTLYPARADGELAQALPSRREHELADFTALIARLPEAVNLWHYGGALPRWYDAVALGRRDAPDLSRRLVDLHKRLRGAASYPAPVFGLDDYVRQALARDPHRTGDAAAVAMWQEAGDPAPRLRDKGRADLVDLAGLVDWMGRGEDGPVS